MKKLVTVMWSTTLSVNLPDGADINTLNDWHGPHAELGGKIISDASNQIEWKQGEITDVQDDDTDLEG